MSKIWQFLLENYWKTKSSKSPPNDKTPNQTVTSSKYQREKFTRNHFEESRFLSCDTAERKRKEGEGKIGEIVAMKTKNRSGWPPRSECPPLMNRHRLRPRLSFS